MIKCIITTGLLSVVGCDIVSAQSYNNPGGTISTCGGTFYDTGGPGGNYGNGQTIITTFCSNAGTCVQLNFTAFNIENGFDFLSVYDGSSTASPLIGTFTGATLPGTMIGTTGCVTFRFTSDATIVSSGWTAVISCAACPPAPPPASAPNQSCATASCVNSSVSSAPLGFGTQELNAANRGCIGSNETNSSWYTITVNTTGNLQFMINPSPASNDLDFAIWGPAGACPPTTAPVRCSYAAGGGPTGISSTNNSPAADNSEGATGNRWVQDLPVVAGQTYVVLVNDYTSGGSFTLSMMGTATYTCSVLPVELLSLKAECRTYGVEILWETATETNSDYFSLQRTIDGNVYQEIARLNGAGTSSFSHSYTVVDNFHITTPVYYRLRQVDFNGTEVTFTPVVAMCNAGGISWEFDIYTNELLINIPDGEAVFHLYNSLGVLCIAEGVKKGTSSQRLAALPAGVYYARIEIGDKVLSREIIIGSD